MKNKSLFYLFTLVLFLGGCSSVPKPTMETLFYPPPPEKAHVQYLTSFSAAEDLEKKPSWFATFLLGEEDNYKPIVKPYGVTVDNGNIYVADTAANTLEILNLEQRKFTYFKPKGSGGKLSVPINVALSSDGRMFVADAGRGQVVVFDPSGKYLTVIGSKRELKPTDIEIFNNRLFVCDLKSHGVRVYNLSNYSYIHSIPANPKDKSEKLFSPTNLAIDDSGNVYVSDTGSFNVKKFTSDGKHLKTFGGHGDSLGRFARNKGVGVDKKGRVYVADAAFENVQIFNPDGKLLMYFPEKNDPASLVLPAGIFIDYEHVDYFKPYIEEGFEVEYLIFVASQYGEHKISVFGYGQNK